MKPASSQRKEGGDESSNANLIQVPMPPPYANQTQSPDFWMFLHELHAVVEGGDRDLFLTLSQKGGERRSNSSKADPERERRSFGILN